MLRAIDDRRELAAATAPSRSWGRTAGILGIVAVLALGGWIANIVKLVGMDFGAITGLLIVRAIGIFIAPLGAVMGFI